MASYRLSEWFVVRVTGAPFDELERLATPKSVQGAHRVRLLEEALRSAGTAALAELRSKDSGMAPPVLEKVRRALGQGRSLPRSAPVAASLTGYADALARLEAARAELGATLDTELDDIRRHLAGSARWIDRYSVFAASSTVQERLSELAGGGETGGADAERGWRDRARDQLLLNYLQRVCAKNDTFSEFGPTTWGRLDPATRGIALAVIPGVARRETYLEKWVVSALVDAMSADPEALVEAAPRLHPSGRIDGTGFVRQDLGETVALSAPQLEALRRVDGRSPAHAIGAGELSELASLGAVLWKFEPPMMESQRMARLVDQVRAWRDGAARARWLPRLEQLASLPPALARELDPARRRAILAEVNQELTAAGGAVKQRGRALYSAANSIGEECVREANLTIGPDLAGSLIDDVGPWLDGFRDAIAYCRRATAAHITGLWREVAGAGGRAPLPALMRHAETRGVPLGGDGIARVASGAFREVQDAFAAAFADRPDAREWEMSAEDCQFVRKHLGVQAAGPADTVWPSIDLQIAAPSVDAVAQGNYDLVLGELNTPCPIVGHGFFWSCPQPDRLATEMRRITGADRACHVSLALLDRASHVIFHWPEIFGDAWTAVSAEKPPAGRRHVAPADAEVILDDATGELRVRVAATGEDLGALWQPWDVWFTWGVHPYVFRRRPHLPRLRMGRTVLQRETWTIAASELPGTFQGVSPALLVAIDRLRSARELPRHVFIRPSDSALAGRHSATGRDKDVKPFYVDLESYLGAEAFHQALAKYGELEVVEMLPAPSDLFWQEADGRRTFELRVLLGPG